MIGNMKYKLIFFIGFLLVVFFIQSCGLFCGIIIENDAVYLSRRIKAEFDYSFSQERKSPLIRLNQDIIKEVKSDSLDQYRAYDLIKLRINSFMLDNNVFIIVDNEVFPVDVEHVDSEIRSTISENRKNILTSDSTKISVVTGYNEHKSKIYRITYIIDNAIIEKIKSSQNVMLRYYAGPDMITIKIKGFNLKLLKKIIATK